MSKHFEHKQQSIILTQISSKIQSKCVKYLWEDSSALVGNLGNVPTISVDGVGHLRLDQSRSSLARLFGKNINFKDVPRWPGAQMNFKTDDGKMRFSTSTPSHLSLCSCFVFVRK